MDRRSRAAANAAHVRGGRRRTNRGRDGGRTRRADPPGVEQGLSRSGPRPRAGGAAGGGGLCARPVRRAAARGRAPVTGEERRRGPAEGQGRRRDSGLDPPRGWTRDSRFNGRLDSRGPRFGSRERARPLAGQAGTRPGAAHPAGDGASGSVRDRRPRRPHGCRRTPADADPGRDAGGPARCRHDQGRAARVWRNQLSIQGSGNHGHDRSQLRGGAARAGSPADKTDGKD